MADDEQREDHPSTGNSEENSTAGSDVAQGDSLEPPTEGEVIPPRRHAGTANLRPFPKGKSGNPSGRPKSKDLSAALRKAAPKRMPADLVGKAPPFLVELFGKRPTVAEYITFRIITQAVQGDMKAIRMIFDRLEGRVPVEAKVDFDSSGLDSLLDALRSGPVPPGGVNE